MTTQLSFDKALAVLQGIARRLRPGGLLALTFQPRQPGATRDDALRGAERLAADLARAGFERVRVELFEMSPVPAVCVLGETPRV